VYVLACCGFILFTDYSPAQLVVFGQYVAGLFGTPVLMVAICWLAFRTDKRVRMNRLSAVLLVLSVVIIAVSLLVSTAIQLFG
jgi:bacteriorhodopsin